MQGISERFRFFVYLSMTVLIGTCIHFSVASAAEREIQLIIEQLRHPDVKVRLDATNKVAKMGAEAKAAVPILAEAALRDQASIIRYASISAIFALGPSATQAVPALAQLLQESSPEYNKITEALAKMGLAGAPALAQALFNANSSVRNSAEYNLAKINPVVGFLGILWNYAFGLSSFKLSWQWGLLVCGALIVLILNIRIDRAPRSAIERGGRLLTLRGAVTVLAGLITAYFLIVSSLALRKFLEVYFWRDSEAFLFRVLIVPGVILSAVLYVLHKVSPASTWGKRSFFLYAALCIEILAVALFELLLPGGHPSLGALVFALAEAANIVLLPLAILAVVVIWVSRAAKSYVAAALTYLSLVVGIHPMVTPSVYWRNIEGALGPIDQSLISDDPYRRARAFEKLGSLDNRGMRILAPRLVKIAIATDSGEPRFWVNEAFKRMGPVVSEVAVPQLSQATEDPDQKVRLRAVLTLLALGAQSDGAGAALVRLLDDPDQDVRRMAAGALHQNVTSATTALIDLLRNGNQRQRIGAAMALNGKAPKAMDALPIVLEMANNSDPQLSRASLTPLRILAPTSKAAFEELVRLAKDTNANQHLAIATLRDLAMDNPGIVSELIRLVDGEDRSTAKLAFIILRQVRVPAAAAATERNKARFATDEPDRRMRTPLRSLGKTQ